MNLAVMPDLDAECRTNFEARWFLYENAVSGDLYPDLDRFDRVVLSRWTG